MQGIFFDRFQCFSVDGFSAVSCDFDVSIRRGKLMSFYSTILSQWYVSAHCYNLYYCLKSALITSLENSMDYIVHGLAKSWTQLSDFPFHHLLSSTRKLGLYTSTGCCDMLPRSLFQDQSTQFFIHLEHWLAMPYSWILPSAYAQILLLTLKHQLDRERSKGPSGGIVLLRLIFNTIIS